MGRTEPTANRRLAYAVGVLGLDLLGLRGGSDPHGLRGALGPLTVHAAVPGVTSCPVATRGTLTSHAAAHTPDRRRGRVEARDDLAQLTELSEYLVHYVSVESRRGGVECNGV
jgi:hypothetical protein